MATFDRFDICEAYWLLEVHYNKDGWLYERPSNQHRSEATQVQLGRMRFRPRPSLDEVWNLTKNGQEIYRDLERRYGFTKLPVRGSTVWVTSYKTKKDHSLRVQLVWSNGSIQAINERSGYSQLLQPGEWRSAREQTDKQFAEEEHNGLE